MTLNPGNKSMRRKLFYLSVALLAFGVGLSLAVKIHWLESDKVILFGVPPVDDEIVYVCPIHENQSVKNNCESEIVSVVWNKLKNDGSGIDDDVITGNIKSCEDLFYKPQTIDLNDDKVDEVILMGERPFFCGSGGDCQTWIISKINNRYEIIFEGTVGENPGDLQLLNAQSHKFRCLKIKQNNHFAADTFGFYNFDGKKYRIEKCLEDANSNYENDDNLPEKLISVKLKNCIQS